MRIPYSEFDYTRGQSRFPSSGSRIRRATFPRPTGEFCADRLDDQRRQDVSVVERRRRTGAREQSRHRHPALQPSIPPTPNSAHAPAQSPSASTPDWCKERRAATTGSIGSAERERHRRVPPAVALAEARVGVGGAGAGAAGIVASTTVKARRSTATTPSLTGTSILGSAQPRRSRTSFSPARQPWYRTPATPTLLYNQGFSTGTLMTVGFDNSRNDVQCAIQHAVPGADAQASAFQLRQHLLQGFGFDPNLRWIRIARNNREIMEVTFRQPDHHHGFADREYLLGLGQRLRERQGAAARAGPGQQDAVRQPETGADRDAGAA